MHTIIIGIREYGYVLLAKSQENLYLLGQGNNPQEMKDYQKRFPELSEQEIQKYFPKYPKKFISQLKEIEKQKEEEDLELWNSMTKNGNSDLGIYCWSIVTRMKQQSPIQ